MHARHRSPGNGYMPNAMGIGGSRVSPDGSSMRNQGFYNFEYRNFNRGGFARGQGRQFQSAPPQPPPRKGDVFQEAGKLAAEYLVSKGLLPPNALSGKLQIGNFNNQVENFHSARSQEGDARTSAISRLGNAAADIGPSRRRNFDEYNSTGSRNYMEGRRAGSFKNHVSELNPELGRSGSWSKRARDSQDMETYDAEEGASGLQNVHSSEESRKSEISTLEKNKSIDDADAIKTTLSSNTEKSLTQEAVVEPTRESVELIMSDVEDEEVRNENINDEADKQIIKEDIAVEPLVDEDKQEAENNIKTDLSKGSEADPEDFSVNGTSIGDSSTPSHDSKIVDSDVKKVPAVEEEQGLVHANGKGNCLSPTAFPKKSPMEDQEGDIGLSGFGSSSSMFMEKGEKQALDDDDSRDATKTHREWAPSVGPHSDGCVGFSNSLEKPQISEEPMTSNFGERPDQKGLLDMSLFPEGDVACVEYTEGNKLFPASFKTCDLNLMEASEVNENHDVELIHEFPSITENGKQAIPVDIDLTMNNNSNATNKYGTYGSHGKDIEVINLENNSTQEDKAFSGSERRDESVFTGLDGFHNNANNNEIPEDGYGLMISELLGNDIPNCSSVPPDMNSLHNDMSLHNGEGILGDDDSIYMALGEIPISFLKGW